jgi:hypothetical protein
MQQQHHLYQQQYQQQQQQQQQQQNAMQQQQQGPPQLGSPGLPEAAPALKTDPVELSLLTRYLQIVRHTQVRKQTEQWVCKNAVPR